MPIQVVSAKLPPPACARLIIRPFPPFDVILSPVPSTPSRSKGAERGEKSDAFKATVLFKYHLIHCPPVSSASIQRFLFYVSSSPFHIFHLSLSLSLFKKHFRLHNLLQLVHHLPPADHLSAIHILRHSPELSPRPPLRPAFRHSPLDCPSVCLPLPIHTSRPDSPRHLPAHGTGIHHIFMALRRVSSLPPSDASSETECFF